MSSYRKIAGVFGTFVGASRLYQNEECLLLVTTVGFGESYRRLYFRDIQGIQICPGPGRLISGIISGIILGLLGLIFGLAVSETSSSEMIYPALFLGVPLILVLVWFVANLVRGKMCRCVVHTAVQSVRLPMLSRVSKASTFIEQVRPMIEQTQGALDPKTLGERLGAAWEEAARVRRAARKPVRGVPVGRRRKIRTGRRGIRRAGSTTAGAAASAVDANAADLVDESVADDSAQPDASPAVEPLEAETSGTEDASDLPRASEAS